MKLSELDELIGTLPSGRTLFTYGKDWYTFELLKYQLTKRQASSSSSNHALASSCKNLKSGSG
ncbi:MAG: hypothetical protein ABGY95_09620 [Rubritalea sp.]|uniref:hypothetical protein n=1 Tax=Rubritalea sp. TaxID=2109375 RepID=UPI0032420F2F